MTEPLSMREIEDVLSSIRRLVAEEPRRDTSGRASGREGGAPETAGKLLLTPALRVVGEGGTPVPGPAVDPVLLHQGLAPARDAASGVNDGCDPATAALETVDELLWAAPADDDVPDDSGAPLHFRHAPHDAGAGADEAPEAVPAAETEPMTTHGAMAAEESGQAMASAGDHLSAEEMTDVAVEDDPGLTELDEEMLRSILRDLIREELSGPLGERITRNVRKLVRIEVNRAMTLQALD